jgi:hypothetical protein
MANLYRCMVVVVPVFTGDSLWEALVHPAFLKFSVIFPWGFSCGRLAANIESAEAGDRYKTFRR